MHLLPLHSAPFTKLASPVLQQVVSSGYTTLFNEFINATLCIIYEVGDARSAENGIVGIYCLTFKCLWANTPPSVKYKEVLQAALRGIWDNNTTGRGRHDVVVRLGVV